MAKDKQCGWTTEIFDPSLYVHPIEGMVSKTLCGHEVKNRKDSPHPFDKWSHCPYCGGHFATSETVFISSKKEKSNG